MHGGRDENNHASQPVMIPRPLGIVADDLTGACDAAVAFTPVCDPVRVQITDRLSDPAWPLAVTTESRDLTPIEAEIRIVNVVKRLPPDIELFKKIDSVFRGNTVTEIAATLRQATFDLAVIAPAYPGLGRTVRDGILHIQEADGDHVLPIGKLLTDAGCSFTTLSAGLTLDELAINLRHSLDQPIPTVLCDASMQSDLERVVRAARSLGKRILWVGSGGLAHALAAQLPLRKAKLAHQLHPGRTIFFIGSTHPVTRAQVDHLRSSTDNAELVPVTFGEANADDIRRAAAAHDPTQIGCLFMTGGDTAHFVCRVLGINALLLKREFAPGVPLAVAEGGRFDGVSVVLKSGGFGPPDLLCRLLETCHPEVIV